MARLEPGPLGRILALLLGPVLATGGAVAQEYPLPLELTLDTQEIVFRLSNATLEVVVSAPNEAPVLRARRATEGEDQGGVLRLVSQGGGLVVESGDLVPDGGIHVEATLPPLRRLRVEGGELAARIEVRVDPGSWPAEDTPRTVLEGKVSDSQLTLVGVHGADMTGTRSELELEASRGTIALRWQGGRAKILRHRGELGLEGRGADFWVSESQTPIRFQLEGGDLVLQDGEGELSGSAQGSFLQLERWSGALSFDGQESTLLVLEAGNEESSLKLQGVGLEVGIEGFRGQVEANLTGGRVTGSGLEGPANLVMRQGGQIEVQGVEQELMLKMENGGTARLGGTRMTLRAELQDSDLVVEGAKRLDLKAISSRIVASDLERLGRLEVVDSELELDLTALIHSPTLLLRGTSSALVELLPPCYVRLLRRETVAESQVRLSGCALESAIRSRQIARRRLDGSRAVILAVDLQDEATLEVEGSP